MVMYNSYRFGRLFGVLLGCGVSLSQGNMSVDVQGRRGYSGVLVRGSSVVGYIALVWEIDLFFCIYGVV